jgi:pyruvate dehydrogenase E2 component (dihydrolipoamide acetyltransferase)
MALPVRAPRLNNNDDFVQIRSILSPVGAPVRKGDPLIELETDKAVFELAAEVDGFLLRVDCAVGDSVAVGTVVAWMGESADEAVPEALPEPLRQEAVRSEPTAKARILLEKHGISAEEVPRSGERLTAQDVEGYIQSRSSVPAAVPQQTFPAPAAGSIHPLNAEGRAMLKTVQWHRDHAAAGYIEIEYDPEPWNSYAAGFMKEQRLFLSPLLPLLAWRLVALAREHPRVNATIVGEDFYAFDHVNLGFTVQSGESLYLAVLHQAEDLDTAAFIARLGELQRRAVARHLAPTEVRDATLSFTSMARWAVTRHMPILPPFTSLIVAHSAPRGGRAVLGATYDHRVLSGFDVVTVLSALAKPPL